MRFLSIPEIAVPVSFKFRSVFSSELEVGHMEAAYRGPKEKCLTRHSMLWHSPFEHSDSPNGWPTEWGFDSCQKVAFAKDYVDPYPHNRCVTAVHGLLLRKGVLTVALGLYSLGTQPFVFQTPAGGCTLRFYLQDGSFTETQFMCFASELPDGFHLCELEHEGRAGASDWSYFKDELLNRSASDPGGRRATA